MVIELSALLLLPSFSFSFHDGRIRGWREKKKSLTVIKAPYIDINNRGGLDSYKLEQSNFDSSASLPVEKVMVSICFITMDYGVWASGVLLNSQGLILTNAHLLEPWRLGKTHQSQGQGPVQE